MEASAVWTVCVLLLSACCQSLADDTVEISFDPAGAPFIAILMAVLIVQSFSLAFAFYGCYHFVLFMKRRGAVADGKDHPAWMQYTDVAEKRFEHVPSVSGPWRSNSTVSGLNGPEPPTVRVTPVVDGAAGAPAAEAAGSSQRNEDELKF